MFSSLKWIFRQHSGFLQTGQHEAPDEPWPQAAVGSNQTIHENPELNPFPEGGMWPGVPAQLCKGRQCWIFGNVAELWALFMTKPHPEHWTPQDWESSFIPWFKSGPTLVKIKVKFIFRQRFPSNVINWVLTWLGSPGSFTPEVTGTWWPCQALPWLCGHVKSSPRACQENWKFPNDPAELKPDWALPRLGQHILVHSPLNSAISVLEVPGWAPALMWCSKIIKQNTKNHSWSSFFCFTFIFALIGEING